MRNLFLFYNIYIFCVWRAYGKIHDGYIYNKHVDGYLKLYQSDTFYNAFIRCDSDGAILASPSNDGYLKALMMMIYPDSEDICGIYTGIHATMSPGHYTTIDGIPLEKIPVDFALDEITSDLGDCTLLLSDGSLVSVSCQELYPYVCYKKKGRNLFVNECGTIYAGYNLYVETGSCYKFHREFVSWKRAQEVCMEEGGYLTIINSEAEAQIVKGLIPPSPHKIMEYISALVGFFDWDNRNLWYTVHGQKLQDAGYSKWVHNQPDNNTVFDVTGEHCGSIVNNGLLNDVSCDHLNLSFICEKDPANIVSSDANK